MQFDGKHVVVTGAGRGIGLALATEFHRRGASVSLVDLAGAESAAAALDGARGYTADLSTEAANAELISTARADGGPIDLFFANAGVALGTDPIAATEAEWDLSFAINVHAHRWAAKYLLPDWLERGDGYFCSTASAAGLLAQIGSAPYSVTKHAAVAFAEWMSITYGDRGIKVSCLCPQGVNTDMLNQDDDFVGGDVVRAAGTVLEPADVAVAVADTIEAEGFFVLPHPEVADYYAARATQTERWLGGMRKLQRRVLGG